MGLQPNSIFNSRKDMFTSIPKPECEYGNISSSSSRPPMAPFRDWLDRGFARGFYLGRAKPRARLSQRCRCSPDHCVGSKDRGVQFWDAKSAVVQCMLQGHKNSGKPLER